MFLALIYFLAPKDVPRSFCIFLFPTPALALAIFPVNSFLLFENSITSKGLSMKTFVATRVLVSLSFLSCQCKGMVCTNSCIYMSVSLYVTICFYTESEHDFILTSPNVIHYSVDQVTLFSLLSCNSLQQGDPGVPLLIIYQLPQCN